MKPSTGQIDVTLVGELHFGDDRQAKKAHSHERMFYVGPEADCGFFDLVKTCDDVICMAGVHEAADSEREGSQNILISARGETSAG